MQMIFIKIMIIHVINDIHELLNRFIQFPIILCTCNMQIVVVTNVNNTLTTLTMRKHYVCTPQRSSARSTQIDFGIINLWEHLFMIKQTSLIVKDYYIRICKLSYIYF